MQDQPTEGEPLGACKIDTIQRSVVNILVDPLRQRPWALPEIVREYSGVGDHNDVNDALGRLTSAGLIHAVDGCYVASRSAVHAFELGILGI
jgi:hypothetical protein